MRSAGFLIAFFLLLQLHAFGQDDLVSDTAVTHAVDSAEVNVHMAVAPETLPVTRAYQSEQITIREFDETKWRKLVGDTNYEEKPVEVPEFELPSVPWAGPLLKILGYGAIIALVVFLVYYLVKNMSFDVKIRRETLTTEDLARPVENIEEIDIEALLAEALRDGNYRMAVRLYYLGLLKRLNALGKIAWQKDKTNRDYLGELFAADFHFPEVRALTLSYEAVWYGDHSPGEDGFERLRGKFEGLYKQINAPEKL